jgi:hypothetical protein
LPLESHAPFRTQRATKARVTVTVFTASTPVASGYPEDSMNCFGFEQSSPGPRT